MNQDCLDVIRLMSQRYQRDITVFEESFLSKSLDKRLALNSCAGFSDYIQLLAESGAEVENFLNSLTINYSLFFRNPLTFAFLDQTIFPLILKSKKEGEEIRVWSAGCAAGQEAYSIAILLDQIVSAEETKKTFRIFATDTSMADLQTAQSGIYDTNAIQNVSFKHYTLYFKPDGECHTISPHLKDRVDFSIYDLLDQRSISPPASIYGDFDLVICSNVLFYYRPDIRQGILNKIFRALSPNGYFVTGEVERGIVEKNDAFRELAPPCPIYQKIVW